MRPSDHRPLQLAVFLAAILAWLLAPHGALAQERAVTIHFDARNDAAPQFACILTAGDIKLAGGMAGGAEKWEHDNRCVHRIDVSSGTLDAAPTCLTKFLKATIPTNSWNGSVKFDTDITANKIACVKSQGFSAEGRFVFLSMGGSTGETGPAITNLALFGDTLTVTLGAAATNGANKVPIFALLDGDYRKSGGTIAAVGSELAMTLLPRSSAVTITIPQTSARAGDKWYQALEDCDKPEAYKDLKVDGTPQQVSLTLETDVTKRHLCIRIGPEACQKDATQCTIEAEGEWTTPLPPKELKLVARGVAVTWERGCEVPRLPAASNSNSDDSCPIVKPNISGVACKPMGGTDNTCMYWCDLKGHSSPLPIAVALSISHKDPHTPGGMKELFLDSWTDEIATGGSTLTSYVADDARYAVIDLEKWIPRRTWARVDRVEIRGPDGAVHVIDIPGDASTGPIAAVRMKGLGCFDYIHYRAYGERGYDEGTLRLGVDNTQADAQCIDKRDENAKNAGASGSPYVKPPLCALDKQTRDRVTFGMVAAGGAFVTFAGLGQVHSRPAGLLEAVLSIRVIEGEKHRDVSPPAMEVRLGSFLSRAEGRRANTDGLEGPSFKLQSSWYLRAYLLFGLAWKAKPVAFGFGVSPLTFGAPFLASDQRTVPIQFFGLVGDVHLEVELVRDLAISLSAKPWLERAYEFSEASSGKMFRSEALTFSTLFAAGFRFGTL